MRGAEIRQIYNEIQGGYSFGSSVINPDINPIQINPIARKNSISVGDKKFGDGGKGATMVKVNYAYAQERPVLSLRANGGANAGHETKINGQQIVTHLLPAGVLQEGVQPVMSRGMVIHPRDLLLEIDDVSQHFNGELPSNPLIDRYAILSLDTHRALEKAVKFKTTGSAGSTGKGIAQGYSSFYDRTAVFIDDLLDDKWEETFRDHYRFIEGQLSGFGDDFHLADIHVSAYDDPKGEQRTVGTEDEFINRLKDERGILAKYVPDNMYDILQSAWEDEETAITIEFGQGAGLDPWFGLYPDVTASRTTSRNLPDVTYGIVQPERIAIRGSVFKTVYMSSVGTRTLPEIDIDSEDLQKIGSEQREYGKTTGRPRPPKHISIPMMQAMSRFDGDQFLIPTHIDAARPGRDIAIITAYRDKDTRVERPYLPFQKEIDKLEVMEHVVFEGYDGEAVAGATSVNDLDDNAKKLLEFYGRTVAPIALATTGQDLKDYMSWIPRSQFPAAKK